MQVRKKGGYFLCKLLRTDNFGFLKEQYFWRWNLFLWCSLLWQIDLSTVTPGSCFSVVFWLFLAIKHVWTVGRWWPRAGQAGGLLSPLSSGTRAGMCATGSLPRPRAWQSTGALHSCRNPAGFVTKPRFLHNQKGINQPAKEIWFKAFCTK